MLNRSDWLMSWKKKTDPTCTDEIDCSECDFKRKCDLKMNSQVEPDDDRSAWE